MTNAADSISAATNKDRKLAIENKNDPSFERLVVFRRDRASSTEINRNFERYKTGYRNMYSTINNS